MSAAFAFFMGIMLSYFLLESGGKDGVAQEFSLLQICSTLHHRLGYISPTPLRHDRQNTPIPGLSGILSAFPDAFKVFLNIGAK